MKVSRRNWRRIAVDLSILFYISWQIRSFRSCVTRYSEARMSIASATGFQREVSGGRYRVQSTRARSVSPGDQFPSLEIYYARLSHSMSRTREKRTKTNRPLRRPDVELYGNERQIAITFPKERRYLLPRGKFSACKCGDIRTRLRGISLVNISWSALIPYIKQLLL